MTRLRTGIVAVMVGLACSDGAPSAIHVEGTYVTEVQLTSNTCGAVTVAPMPTVVVHRPGETGLTLTHGPVSYQGTLESDGEFSTEATSVGSAHVIQIGGRFTVTGFTATVNVQRSEPAPACSYVVEWVGTRQGGENTIP